MLNLVRYWPSHWPPAYILILGVLGLVLRWMVSTLSGVLVLVLGLYGWQVVAGESKPMTAQQLAIWVSEVPPDALASLAGAVITVIGFLVAFRTASMNWREQTLAGLRLSVAGEIQQVYDEVSDLVLEFKSYSADLAECLMRAQTDRGSRQSFYELQVRIPALAKFLEQRSRFSILSVEVYRLLGKNYSICASLPGLRETLQRCEECVQEVANEMWVHVPVGDYENPMALEEVAASLVPFEWERFAACCERNYDRLGVLTSAARSALFKGLHDVTLFSILDLVENHAFVRKGVKLFRDSSERGR